MSNELQNIKPEVFGEVEDKLGSLADNNGIDLPENYSARNALKQAYLKLQSKDEPVFDKYKDETIYNALLDTLTQGLNPGKDQVYYIGYGNHLTAQKSYFGNIALAKRMAGVQEVSSNVILEGDEVDISIERGQQVIESHDRNFDSMDGQVKGAYAVISFEDERKDKYEIMTLKELKQAWAQGKSFGGNGKSPHHKFTKEMAKKTVINRALKPLIKASDDSGLIKEKPKLEKLKDGQQERTEGEKIEEVDVDKEEVVEVDYDV
uniref:RecT protein n=1 Tax=uncultured organism TaxID=155900 RepID=M1PVG4_9ZZZZ|nr:RecT protein [uncultured organism]